MKANIYKNEVSFNLRTWIRLNPKYKKQLNFM